MHSKGKEKRQEIRLGQLDVEGIMANDLRYQLNPNEIREAAAAALTFLHSLSDVPGLGRAPGGRETKEKTSTFQVGGVITIVGGVPKGRSPLGNGLSQYWKGGNLPQLAKSCVEAVGGCRGWQGTAHMLQNIGAGGIGDEAIEHMMSQRIGSDHANSSRGAELTEMAWQVQFSRRAENQIVRVQDLSGVIANRLDQRGTGQGSALRYHVSAWYRCETNRARSCPQIAKQGGVLETIRDRLEFRLGKYPSSNGLGMPRGCRKIDAVKTAPHPWRSSHGVVGRPGNAIPQVQTVPQKLPSRISIGRLRCGCIPRAGNRNCAIARSRG